MVLLDCVESCSDFVVSIEALLVDQLVQPSAVKQSLHFGEDRFNWVEFGTVADVPQGCDVQFGQPLSHVLLRVHLQPVHEKGKWPFAVLHTKVFDVLDEFGVMNGLLSDHYEANARFFRH